MLTISSLPVVANKQLTSFKHSYEYLFAVKDLGNLSNFLGIEVLKQDDGITHSHSLGTHFKVRETVP
jgi:hypothetical protein